MSKKMSCAYWALRMKDAAAYYSTVALKIAMLCFAFSLMAIRTTMFATALVASVSVGLVALVLLLVAFLCDRRIRNLGFSEVELERWGLA